MRETGVIKQGLPAGEAFFMARLLRGRAGGVIGQARRTRGDET